MLIQDIRPTCINGYNVYIQDGIVYEVRPTENAETSLRIDDASEVLSLAFSACGDRLKYLTLNNVTRVEDFAFAGIHSPYLAEHDTTQRPFISLAALENGGENTFVGIQQQPQLPTLRCRGGCEDPQPIKVYAPLLPKPTTVPDNIVFTPDQPLSESDHRKAISYSIQIEWMIYLLPTLSMLIPLLMWADGLHDQHHNQERAILKLSKANIAIYSIFILPSFFAKFWQVAVPRSISFVIFNAVVRQNTDEILESPELSRVLCDLCAVMAALSIYCFIDIFYRMIHPPIQSFAERKVRQNREWYCLFSSCNQAPAAAQQPEDNLIPDNQL